jgi:hypothetical protein
MQPVSQRYFAELFLPLKDILTRWIPMTSLFNTEIKVYFENDEAIQADKSLIDMFEVSRETEKLWKIRNGFLLVILVMLPTY